MDRRAVSICTASDAAQSRWLYEPIFRLAEPTLQNTPSAPSQSQFHQEEKH